MTVYTLKCGSCGLIVSAMEKDRAKSMALDHLQSVHSGRLQSTVAVPHTEGDAA